MIRNYLPIYRIVLTLLAVLALSACGGTKVYDSTKTIVYNGSIYQVTDVKQITGVIEAVNADETTLDLKNRSREQVTELINENKPLFVRMSFQLDDQTLVYLATQVESYRDYNRMLDRFENANRRIARLMSAKKTEQLNLR